MSQDIKPGDLVVCVDDAPCYGCGARPDFKENGVYRVVRTDGVRIGVEGRIHAWHPDAFAHRFRKLNDEPDNAELIERIKACRPVRVREQSV